MSRICPICNNESYAWSWYKDQKMCFECPLAHLDYGYCKITAGDIEYFVDNNNKPHWCPLKDVPKKIGVEEALKMPRNGNLVDVINSYNACIDEILGGNECGTVL